jgi:hypothetical protein
MLTGWPDLAAYKAWARIGDDVDDVAITAALAAVQVYVTEQATLLDGAGDDPVTIPADLNQACLLLTNRLLARRNSPEGVVGSNDGTVVNIGRSDPDAARLIARYVAAKLA